MIVTLRGYRPRHVAGFRCVRLDDCFDNVVWQCAVAPGGCERPDSGLGSNQVTRKTFSSRPFQRLVDATETFVA